MPSSRWPLLLVMLGPVTVGPLARAAGTVREIPLTVADQVRPFSGKPVAVKRVACQAEGRPDLAAAMYLEEINAVSYQVVRLEYNDAAHALLEVARQEQLPQMQKYYQKYVTEQQPTNRLILNALIGTWKLFGLKFSWQDATYHCQLS